MSVQAIAWVLEDAPDLPHTLVGTLIGLANHADRYGRNSHPSIATLASYARKGSRSIQKDLRELEKLGLIRHGDQRLVAYLRPDRRPTVYDLAMDRSGANHKTPRTAKVGVNRGSPRRPEAGRTTRHPVGSERGERDDTPKTASGVNSRVERGEPACAHGVSHSSPEPSTKPSTNPLPLARATTLRLADALRCEEEEAEKVFQLVIAERAPAAPARYVATLIESGDIHQFLIRVRSPVRPPSGTGYGGPTHRYEDDGAGTCRHCHLPPGNPRHKIGA